MIGVTFTNLRLVSYRQMTCTGLTSAVAYIRASKPDKALKAYEKAHAWRELFALANEQAVAKSVLLGMCERSTDHLASRGRSIEAAQIYVEYAQDVESAVDVLCKGAEFAEARRLVSGFICCYRLPADSLDRVASPCRPS